MKKTIATAQETKRLMAKHQFHTKKKLGQNFGKRSMFRMDTTYIKGARRN